MLDFFVCIWIDIRVFRYSQISTDIYSSRHLLVLICKRHLNHYLHRYVEFFIQTKMSCTIFNEISNLRNRQSDSQRNFNQTIIIYNVIYGLMVKALSWQSFDRQFEPHPRAIKVAPLWCSDTAVLDAVQNLMVQYTNKGFFYLMISKHRNPAGNIIGSRNLTK